MHIPGYDFWKLSGPPENEEFEVWCEANHDYLNDLADKYVVKSIAALEAVPADAPLEAGEVVEFLISRYGDNIIASNRGYTFGNVFGPESYEFLRLLAKNKLEGAE